jgi:hypothetical protein
VNLGKIAKQLRREAKANPKKVVVLGLVLAAAAYFWAPLLGRWFGNSRTTDLSTAAAMAPAAGNPAVGGETVKAAGESNSGVKLGWQEFERARQLDPRTRPIRMNPALPDPFALTETKVRANVREAEPETKETTATPQSLGLSLSSTVVGTKKRLAHINGRNYREGQVLDVVKDGQHYTFTLGLVEARKVVLSRDGEDYELTIPVPGQSGSIEVAHPQGAN